MVYSAVQNDTKQCLIELNKESEKVHISIPYKSKEAAIVKLVHLAVQNELAIDANNKFESAFITAKVPTDPKVVIEPEKLLKIAPRADED